MDGWIDPSIDQSIGRFIAVFDDDTFDGDLMMIL